MELQQDNARGLYKDEVMEIVWMVYPPKATGFDPMKRSQWMKRVGGGGQINFFGGKPIQSQNLNIMLICKLHNFEDIK